jgi:hypothetical protein
MENELITISLCPEDWERVKHALRNEAFALEVDSRRASGKGATDYATLLLDESAIRTSIADTIDYKLPE